MRDLIKHTTQLRDRKVGRDREKKSKEEKEEEKKQHLAGFNPMTSILLGVCSTTVLQPQPQHHGSMASWLRGIVA